jgi:hypothetical protein
MNSIGGSWDLIPLMETFHYIVRITINLQLIIGFIYR